ncbi:MAG: hypothetical protein Q8Q24_02110, partial [bacterium]|nr:hypothetical protein [bacterium]
ELKAVKEILLQELGLSEGTLEERKVRDYVSQPSKDATVPGEIRVSVYETSRDGLYFQELTFPDNQKRWMVGPDQDV